ncbi:electron transport complex RnfABCDGE type A subunit [Clostridium sp. CAG:149]|nr:electron transport complex RnfABCDGE type A subunit [Clostridium sp. CAG:149]
MGAAVIFVITIASAVTNIIYTVFLNPETNIIVIGGQHVDLNYLQTIVFILVIAALVQFVEMFLKKNMVSLYQSLGVYLPLITTNCAVLGVALNNVTDGYNFIQSVVSGIGISVGFTIAIILLAGVREKIEHNDVPYNFQGSPIVLITAGLMSIAFFGFSGLI